MANHPVPFDTEAPLGARRAIIRYNPDDAADVEMVEATWGSNPRFSGGLSYRFVRSEGQTFPNQRCLVPASEFHIMAGERRYRVTLASGDHFYLAGVWEPAMDGWPLAYRIITVAANPEVGPFQERHGAIIYRHQVKLWLDRTVPEIDILETPPAGTFLIEEIDPAARQRSLAL